MTDLQGLKGLQNLLDEKNIKGLNPGKIKQIKEFVDLVKNTLTQDEFLEAFKKIIEHQKKLGKELEEKIDNKTKVAEEDLVRLNEILEGLKDSFQEAIDAVIEERNRIVEENNSSLITMKKWAMDSMNKYLAKSGVKDVVRDFEAEAQSVLDRLNSLEAPDIESLASEAKEMAMGELKDMIPNLEEKGEVMAEALNSIEEEDDKIKISAIKGLEEALKKLGRAGLLSGAGGSTGKRSNKYDLSDSLDGSTKTFTLPAFYRILTVHSSSAPWIFRETTDYTADAAASTITFTSEIEASTTLASGQTIIITYEE